MFTSHLILTSFFALATASLTTPDSLFATLLKRQAPGSPEYACHDNCGTAITVSKAGSDYCTDEVFLFDYQNCLQCAGPDNVDIWKYYGGSLVTAAGKCNGLDTEPKSGKQEDVGDAKHPGSGSGASSVVSTSAPASTAEAVTESITTEEVVTKPAGSTKIVQPVTVSAESTTTAASAPTVTGAPYATGNGTSNGTTPTTSAPSGQFSGSAETVQVRNVVALIGAVAAMGAFY